MRRMLLVSNSNAYRVTPYQRAVIARALGAEFKLEEAETNSQGHAIDIAREAVADGVEVVAALGGDGTLNEVANGLAGTEVLMAVIPAGMANVFARSVGLPNDPVEATGWLLQNPGAPGRRIPLGRVGERYFLVSCGIGFDAAIVREVERRQRAKRRGGDWFFVRTGIRVFFRSYDRRIPLVHLAWGRPGEHERDGLFLAIVQNASPYTYLGRRDLRLCPEADLEDALDCLALDSMRARVAIPVVLSGFGSGRHVRKKHVVYVKAQPEYRIRCDEPLPVQVDGEFMGDHTDLIIESVPSALNVLF